MAVSLLPKNILPFAFPGLPNIFCAFTTRLSGNISLYRATLGEVDETATRKARNDLFTATGAQEWTELKQIHGDVFLIDPAATSVDEASPLEADGLATSRKGHALCIKTADCQPILLAHPAGYIAAVHAGWRGNVLEFPRTSVTRFCEAYGVEPSEVRAVRGPSLGYAEFTNFDAEWPAAFAPWYDRETKCMDLWRLTRDQLLEAGLKPGNIHGLDLCTYSLSDSFFSYRKGDAGRQCALIWM